MIIPTSGRIDRHAVNHIRVDERAIVKPVNRNVITIALIDDDISAECAGKLLCNISVNVVSFLDKFARVSAPGHEDRFLLAARDRIVRSLA